MEIKTHYELYCDYEDNIKGDPHKKWVAVDDEIRYLEDCLEYLIEIRKDYVGMGIMEVILRNHIKKLKGLEYNKAPFELSEGKTQWK